MAGATAFLVINVWTGAPLLALWAGSKTVGEQRLSMAAVFVVVIVLIAIELAMIFALSRLDSAYKQMTGHALSENRMTWLRSMNTQGETVGLGVPLSMLERIVMASVYLGVIAFLVWYVFFAGSPLLAAS